MTKGLGMRAGVLLLMLVGLLLSGCNMAVEARQPAGDTGVVLTSTPAPSTTPAPSLLPPTRTPGPAATALVITQTVNTARGTACAVRGDWPIYIVVAGDTLGTLARRTGTTVGILSAANCLVDANLIAVGQRLRIPPDSLDVSTPVGPPTPNGVRVGGQLAVSPVIGNEAGWLVLQAGSTVTVTWPRAERLGAVEVNFTLAAPGTGTTPIYIGTDINSLDGVSIQWAAPQTGTQGYLEATAGTLGGRVLVDRTQVPLQVLAAPLSPGGGVQINAFTVSPNPVQRGGTLTLSWTTSGANSVQIVRYSENDIPIDEAWGRNLPPGGSLTYALPAQEYFNHVSFVLSANPGQVDSHSQRADVDVSCPFATIFFGCPMTQQTVSVIYQPFERGFMFARRDARKVYVLYADNHSWEVFEDTWEGEPIYPSMPEDGSIPCLSAFRPQGVLGKVWWTRNPVLPTRLGCGTAPQVEYSTSWEEHRGWRPDGMPSTLQVFHWPAGGNLVLDPSSGWASPSN